MSAPRCTARRRHRWHGTSDQTGLDFTLVSTIQAAVDAASPGEVVTVHGGDYIGIVVGKSGVNIIATGDALLFGTFDLRLVDDVEICGFAIIPNRHGQGIQTGESANIVIRNNSIVSDGHSWRPEPGHRAGRQVSHHAAGPGEAHRRPGRAHGSPTSAPDSSGRSDVPGQPARLHRRRVTAGDDHARMDGRRNRTR